MVFPGYLMAGKTQRAGGRYWVYLFTRVQARPGGIALRACHGAKIPHVFDTHDTWLPTDDTDRRLTKTLMGYWTHFARSGNPNADGLPARPVYDAADAKVMALGDEIAPPPAPDHTPCREMPRHPYGVGP
jgi:para-nitrobenzyl esterase